MKTNFDSLHLVETAKLKWRAGPLNTKSYWAQLGQKYPKNIQFW